MINFFKKKTQIVQESTPQIVESVPDDISNYIYCKDALPKEYRNLRVSIDTWQKSDGDIVKKGESICKLKFENKYGISAHLYSDDDGVLETLKQPSKDKYSPEFLIENERVFRIYKIVDKQKIFELKDKKLYNIPLIKVDDFSKTKEVHWESIAGKMKTGPYDMENPDCLWLHSHDENCSILLFTFNNIDNKDFIIFRYPSKIFKLTIGSKISFLFENEEIIEFEIITTPHKYNEHYSWGHFFETRVQLTIQELETLKTQVIKKWKIEFPKTGKKITAIVEDEDIKYSINKLAKEYHDIVKREISNYQALNNKQETTIIISPNNEECYLYLMVDLTNNYYKIGISNKPTFREKTLQSEKPSIEMICSKRFPNRKIATSFEQALHQTYGDKRLRGEWFVLTDKEASEIKESLTT